MIPVKVRPYPYHGIMIFFLIFCRKSEVDFFVIGVPVQ